MVTTIEIWSKSEIPVVIRFLNAEGNSSTEIHQKLTPFMVMMS